MANTLTSTIQTTDTPPPAGETPRRGSAGRVRAGGFAGAADVGAVDVGAVAVGFSGNRSMSFRGNRSRGDAATDGAVALPITAAAAHKPITTARAAK